MSRFATWAKVLAASSIVALVVTAAACGSAGRGSAEAVDALETVDGVERLLDATFGVEATGCSLVPRFGSGVLIEAGLVATAAHTVAGASEIVLHDRNGVAVRATLAALDVDRDLAIVAINDAASARATLAFGDAVAGDAGWLLSWSPTGGARLKPIEVTRRIRVTIEDIYVENVVERKAIEIEGDVVVGDSGAAVVDGDGTIIGLVYGASRDDGSGFAVRIEEVASLLADPAPTTTSRCVP